MSSFLLLNDHIYHILYIYTHETHNSSIQLCIYKTCIYIYDVRIIYIVCVYIYIYYSLVETTSRAQVQSQWVCHQPFQSQICLSRRIVTPAACNPSKSEGPCSKTNYFDLFYFLSYAGNTLNHKRSQECQRPKANEGDQVSMRIPICNAQMLIREGFDTKHPVGWQEITKKLRLWLPNCRNCLSFVRKKSLETVLLPVKHVGLKPCN